MRGQRKSTLNKETEKEKKKRTRSYGNDFTSLKWYNNDKNNMKWFVSNQNLHLSFQKKKKKTIVPNSTYVT